MHGDPSGPMDYNISQRESIVRFESIMTGLQNTNSDIMMGSDTNFDFMKLAVTVIHLRYTA